MTKTSTITTETRNQRRRKLVLYFIFGMILIILLAFATFKLFENQAFLDRGVSRNQLPILHTTSNTNFLLLEEYNDQFRCDLKDLIKLSGKSSHVVGIFPYLLKNHRNVCNRVDEFVGYDKYIDAMLFGDRTVTTNHRPGINGLKSLVSNQQSYDLLTEFYWWMFPIPIASPERGFAYTIFQGDYSGLIKAAKRRGVDFHEIYLEGIRLFYALNGWDIRTGKTILNNIKLLSFQERDHVFTKAWISISCYLEFLADTNDTTGNHHSHNGHNDNNHTSTVKSYKITLETFMEQKNIRYPADYKCITVH